MVKNKETLSSYSIFILLPLHFVPAPFYSLVVLQEELY